MGYDLQDIPYIFEVGFGIDQKHSGEGNLTKISAVNFSPVLKSLFDDFDNTLQKFRIDSYDPICLLIHFISPLPNILESGKGKISLDYIQKQSLEKILASVTKQWQKMKRQSDKDNRVILKQFKAELSSSKKSLKDWCYEIIPEAYMKASANNTLPANARQIMYSARSILLNKGVKIWENDSLFTQTYLPDFLAEHPELRTIWNVVYDARGNFVEPHSDRKIPLGTLAVREYLECNQRLESFKNILFVEKEGFDPLLFQSNILKKYDLGLMSTKGLPNVASRELIQHLSDKGCRIFVLHDFDKSGLAIEKTLKTNNRRFEYQSTPNIIDLGLRLDDVNELSLQSELVSYGDQKNPKNYLSKIGCSQDEIDFLVREKNYKGKWEGQRVELNAIPSDIFVSWLERKLVSYGVEKFLPEPTILESEYLDRAKQKIYRQELDKYQQEVDRILASMGINKPSLSDIPDPQIPLDISQSLSELSISHPNESWQCLLNRLIENQL